MMRKSLFVWLLGLTFFVVSARAAADSGRVIGKVDVNGVTVKAFTTGQCVEFARRVARAVGTDLPYLGSNGGAYEFYGRAVNDQIPWLARPNGGYDAPEVWDCIVWEKAGTPGHIAVVKELDFARNRLKIVEQNWPGRDGEVWLKISHDPTTKRWTVPKRGSYTVLGWIHPWNGVRPYAGKQVLMVSELYLAPGERATRQLRVHRDGGDVVTITTSTRSLVVDVLDATSKLIHTGVTPMRINLPVQPQHWPNDAYYYIRVHGVPQQVVVGELTVTCDRPSAISIRRATKTPEGVEIVCERDGAYDAAIPYGWSCGDMLIRELSQEAGEYFDERTTWVVTRRLTAPGWYGVAFYATGGEWTYVRYFRVN